MSADDRAYERSGRNLGSLEAMQGGSGYSREVADSTHIAYFNYILAKDMAIAEGMTEDSTERDARIEQILKEMK